MQLTTHTDYALRLLIYLSVMQQHTPLTVQDAAERFCISTNHLAKVTQRLVQLGYVSSRRGRNGGLELAIEPRLINIGELVRATESFCLVECLGEASSCPIEPACRLKGVLAEAQKAFLNVLDQYCLSDLTYRSNQLSQLLEVV